MLLNIEITKDLIFIIVGVILVLVILVLIITSIFKNKVKMQKEVNKISLNDDNVQRKEELKTSENEIEKEDLSDKIKDVNDDEKVILEEKKQDEEKLLEEVPFDNEEDNKQIQEDITTKKEVLGKYEIFKNEDMFQFQLKASNGQVLVQSERYLSKDGAINAIDVIKKNVEQGNISINKDKNDHYQFKLIALNKRVLVSSANYESEKAVNNAVNSFKRFALNSVIVDSCDNEVVQNSEEFLITDISHKQGGKIEVQEENNKYYYSVYASNGEMLCTSERYATKSACLQAIEKLKNSLENRKFYVVKDKMGLYQYKLYNNQNRLLVFGQTYSTKQQAKASAQSLCDFIENCKVETIFNKE